MPHRVTRPGLRFVLLPYPSQFSFVVAKYLNCAHTNTHIRAHAHTRTRWPPTLSILLWRQAPWISCLAPDFFYLTLASHSLYPCILFSFYLSLPVLSLEPKQTLEEHVSLFSSSQETKTNLMEKLKFFFYFFFVFFKFKAQCLSIFQSVCLSPLPGSVCEHRVT